ncbi:hypothetical protein ACE6H2_001428 [Prunus campanulata]
MLWCSDEVMIFMRLVPMDVNYNISKFELHWTSIAYPTNSACYHSSGNPKCSSFYLHIVILILLVTITLQILELKMKLGARELKEEDKGNKAKSGRDFHH